jgi:hypothetical protein
MNGNVTFVELNFQERVEEEHLKKEGNDGKVTPHIVELVRRLCVGIALHEHLRAHYMSCTLTHFGPFLV